MYGYTNCLYIDTTFFQYTCYQILLKYNQFIISFDVTSEISVFLKRKYKVSLFYKFDDSACYIHTYIESLLDAFLLLRRAIKKSFNFSLPPPGPRLNSLPLPLSNKMSFWSVVCLIFCFPLYSQTHPKRLNWLRRYFVESFALERVIL